MEVPESTSDLLAVAKGDAIKRVQADLRGLFGGSRALLGKIAERLREPGAATLFPPGFGAAELKAATKASPETLERLRDELGVDLQSYLARLKVEAARGLLRYRAVKVWEIADFVGYSGLQPFWRAFKTATGESPSEYRERSEPRKRKRYPATELNSDIFWWRATVGALPPAEHRELLARLRRRCCEQAPGAALLGHESASQAAVAERLWATLEPLPDAERRLRLRHLRVDSPAFFHRMGEEIRGQVRKDPRACLELAEQLLVHLDAHAGTLCAQDPNLRVLALAWRANARLLVVDLGGAERG